MSGHITFPEGRYQNPLHSPHPSYCIAEVCIAGWTTGWFLGLTWKWDESPNSRMRGHPSLLCVGARLPPGLREWKADILPFLQLPAWWTWRGLAGFLRKERSLTATTGKGGSLDASWRTAPPHLHPVLQSSLLFPERRKQRWREKNCIKENCFWGSLRHCSGCTVLCLPH